MNHSGARTKSSRKSSAGKKTDQKLVSATRSAFGSALHLAKLAEAACRAAVWYATMSLRHYGVAVCIFFFKSQTNGTEYT